MDNAIQIHCGSASLCDGSPTGGRCEKFALNGTALIQDSLFINAAWVTFIDRFNKSNQLQFTVYTQHSSAVRALAFAGQRRENIAGVIDLTVALTNGAESVTLYAAGAKWDKVASQPEALGSRVTYSVTTGQLVTTLDGGSGSPFAIPFEPLASINPLLIPTGMSATLAAGEAGFYYGLKLSLNAGFRVAAGAHLQLLPTP